MLPPASQSSKRTWADTPTLDNAEASRIKQLLTASRTNHALLGRGASESPRKTSKDEPKGSPESWLLSLQDGHSSKRHKKTQLPTSASTAAFNTSRSSFSHTFGAKSGASTSREHPASASRRSSKGHSARSTTQTFTLWQAKNLFGRTATLANAFSSLTSIRAALADHHSYGSWMDILSNFQSKEDLSMLASLSSSLRPTTRSRNGTTQLSDDDSSEEDTSSSQDSEEDTQSCSDCSDSEEITSENCMSDE